MKRKGYNLLLLLSAVWMAAGCKSYRQQQDEQTDTPLKGTIRIVADESFKPVIDAQVKVYESNRPGTHINVSYMPEADCFNAVWPDSVRMLITTKELSREERQYISDSVHVRTEQAVVARDAVAVIIHPGAADSLFTMIEIREILSGRFKKNLIPVFDGIKATSTVRFIVDSVLRGESLTSKALAARSSDSVINYIAAHPDAIGFIGVSWIGDSEDSSQLSFLKKVKIAYIESTDRPGSYILPVQANIYTKRYPMVRDLVYLLKEKHRGLGTGFAKFMTEEIGQLVFKRAYLVPMLRNFRVRPIQVSEREE